jgi:hypothetical protein
MRAEFAKISVAFDLMPPLSGGGLAIVINPGGTALTVTAGTLALTGAFSTTGLFSTTLVQTASTVLTLPGVNGTLATTASIGALATIASVTAETARATAAEGTNATAVATETSRATTAEGLLAPKASPALTGTPTAPTAAPGTNTTQVASTAYSTAAVLVETNRATTAEGLLAPKASPALTGVPTAPTASTGTNTTQIATTAYVIAEVGSLSTGVSSVNSRTGAVTLALSDIPGAAPLASPTLTGTPAAPTASPGTNTTQVATTAFDHAAILVETNRATAAEALLAPLASPTFTGTATAAALTTTGLISPASGVGIKGSLVAVPAGSIGQTIQQTAGSSFADATPSNLMAITIPTAGIWVGFANTILSPLSGGTTMTAGFLSVTTNSGVLSAGVAGARAGLAILGGGVQEMDLATGPFIFITTGSTTLFAVGYVSTLASTGGQHANGLLTAVRIA